jgi:hypothetical protein
MSEANAGQAATAASAADDALLFVYGIGSRYFADVVTALRTELTLSDPAQAQALDTLCARLAVMRDLLERRLTEMRQLELVEEEAHRGNTDHGQPGAGEGSALAGAAG